MSAPPSGSGSQPPPAPASENFSPELLRMYYDRVFQAAAMCRWLSYGTAQLADTGP